MSQAHRKQQAAQDADGDQGDQGAERSCPGDLRALQEQMVPSDANQFYRPRPGQRMTTQPAGLNSNQGEMLGGISIGGEQILNRELLGSYLPGKFNQGDQIEQRSCPGDLRGPQQEMAPLGENQDFHKSPAHTPQPTGLNSHQQQMLGGMKSEGEQLTQGHQGPRQQQCQVASDGSQGLDSKSYFAEPMTRTRMLGDQQGGKTLLPHRTIGQPPIWVNSKQSDRFLRHRAFREKKGRNIQIPRKPYMHESRHKHAKERPRGIGGQFSKKLVEGEVIAKDDSKGHSEFGSHSHRLEHSNQGVMAQDSGQDSDLPNHFGQPGINVQDSNHSLQDGGFLSSQSMLVQDSSQGLQDGRLSNSPEWKRCELRQSNMMAQDSSQSLQPRWLLNSLVRERSEMQSNQMAQDSSQGLQTGRLSKSYPLTSFGQGTIVQGSNHSSQSDEGFSNSQSRLVRYASQGLQNGGFASPPMVGVQQGGVQQPKPT